MNRAASASLIAFAFALACSRGTVPVQDDGEVAPTPYVSPDPQAQEDHADYLDAGTSIAALRLVSWEDTAPMARAYPVRVEQVASAETGGRYQVEPLIPVEGAAEAESDAWRWTPFVFSSRPALAEELEVGMYVLCVDLERELTHDELRRTSWRLRRITDLSRLDEGLVQVSHYSTYYHEERSHLTHVANTRVVTSAIDAERLSF